ncbi:MAG: ABC transporter substrate binding protein [Pseudolabrys sp.]
MCALNKNVSEDPVRLGLVASFARPGGNATGINFFSGELVAKRLELLRELVPGAARVAVLVNPTNAGNTETTVRDVEAAARIMGLHIQVLHARTSSEINAAFTTFVRERPEPAVYASETFARNGGLIYYGTDWQKSVPASGHLRRSHPQGCQRR